MAQYTPPLRDMQFLLQEVFNAPKQWSQLPAYTDMDMDTVMAVLEEAGKFASEVLLPLNGAGDTQGCKLNPQTHEVTTPQGFKEAYDQYVAGGWPALACASEFGGQGLPLTVNQCLYEMLNSANQSWTMYPGLTHGAYASSRCLTTTVMWLVRLLIRNARPMARGLMRFRVGPSFT